MGALRFLLALSVLCGHAGGFYGLVLPSGLSAVLVGGDTAVQTFFLISGFYMALVWQTAYGRLGTGVFLASRFLRLAPLYWIVSLATAATLVLSGGGLGLYTVADAGAAALALASNVLLVGQDVFLFFGYAPETGFVFVPDTFGGGFVRTGTTPGWGFLMIEQGWSIGVEVWFYLLAPFLLRLPNRALVAVIAISLAARIAAKLMGLEGGVWAYRFFPFELCVFLTGSLMARMYMAGRFVFPRLGYAALAAILFLVILYPLFPVYDTVRRVAVVGAVAALLPTLFALTKDWRMDRRIGELSYPLYLVHMLVLMLLPRDALGDWTGIACAVVSVLVSAILLMTVDEPVDRFRQRVLKRRSNP